jgi:hypothetical protein
MAPKAPGARLNNVGRDKHEKPAAHNTADNLGGLLIYAWMVGHHPSPAYPETQFVNILYFTAIVVTVAYVVYVVTARLRKKWPP